MTIEYLSVDTLIVINARQDGDVGVREMEGVEANAFRPQSGFGEQDVFEDVWSKAAAYAHGIASTQYFHDGNKRTAWLAANMFLDGNGYELPPIADIEAEMFINAVALDAWKADGDRATIEKAAEWFRSRWENSRAGSVHDPRIEFAYLAHGVVPNGTGTWSAYDLGAYQVQTLSDFPLKQDVSVICRIHWRPDDVPAGLAVAATILPANASDARRPDRYKAQFQKAHTPPSGHQHHRFGVMPTLAAVTLEPLFHDPGDYTVRLYLGDDLAAEMPYRVSAGSPTPDTVPTWK
ncbi:type II toxin-antitoxin system death-on-curing family toxin [Rhodococcoides corynebacterioides]|uniref:type II toxin-antitoxin system death-on-curing family toxin n=1 Tax=Rhodococcoides corynebacterioides TaxID=53972 RepID=UPI000835E8C8|nr:Fic family protein [Rhodococcus corynebacterioides]